MIATRAPRVVIVGAGFAGLAAAKRLLKNDLEVLLIDGHNYHLFQPLLYQVAAAYLAPEEIAKPVRAIFRKFKRFDFRLTEVTGVDFATRTVHTASGTISYDYLILATGARPHFYGMSGLERYAFSLKDLEDAVGIRSHIMHCFETASHETNNTRRGGLLTFAVGGGGSAGVEMAGALAELVNNVLVKDYPGLRWEDVHIYLFEATNTILPDLPKDLSRKAIRILEKKGVEVKLGTYIEDFTGKEIAVRGSDTGIQSHTLIWTGGIRSSALAADLGLRVDNHGRILVDDMLRIPGHPESYAVGDTACIAGDEIPMVAPAAVQTAERAADNIVRHAQGKSLKPFVYKNPGALATIGRNAAVAHILGLKISGFPAWLVWLVVHLIRLVGFRNRMIVLINWAWDYVFLERASRLIFRRHLRQSDS
jgi:NADH dehydrogenase